MKTMRYFLVLASILFLAGCATTFRPWSLSQVTEGMSRSEVVQILGEPDYVFVKDDAEHLRYTYQEDLISSYMPVTSVHNSVFDEQRQAMQIERSVQVLMYDVILVDDKVLNYKEVTN